MSTPASIPSWTLDPEDPRAPSQEVWERLSAEERALVVAALPLEPPALQLMGQGDVHYDATDEARKGLKRLFGKRGRSVYVGTDLTVYYPAEAPFAPDVFAVLDVSDHARKSWVVSSEGRGLDFALEIAVSGDRKKDTVGNVARYARLGIQEYFVLQPERRLLSGHRLPPSAASYVALAPHQGRFRSQVLDLEFALEPGTGRLRFFTDGAQLPFQQEIIAALESAVDETLDRVSALAAEVEAQTLALAEERRAREDQALALADERRAREDQALALADERRAREAAERERDELRAELDRLKR